MSFFRIIKKYSKNYKNYLHVMWNVYRNNFPINATLRNGEKRTINNLYECNMIDSEILEGYSFNGNIITITQNQTSEIKLDIGNNNGNVFDIWFKKKYERLEVTNKVVLDIGANIGDSSIYFATRGSEKVIALEPFPKNCTLAKKNINMNNLSQKIIFENAGCASKNGSITINPDDEGSDLITDFSTKGIQIPTFTIKDMVEKHKIPNNSILKIDCEGCEVDILLNIEKETIQLFSEIQVEYHFGYENIKQKLESFGFDVITSIPHQQQDTQSEKILNVGFLYAKKISKHIS